MPDPGGADSRWDLRGFIEELDEWVELESADDDVWIIVGEWLLSRFDDPYRGMKREPEFEDLWFGVIPHTERDESAVVCSYFVGQRTHTVTCDRIGTLHLPS